MKSHNTVVFRDEGKRKVVYHKTVVISHDLEKNEIKINSGGWQTKTTKDRINAYFKEYLNNHWLRVYSKNYQWKIENKDSVFNFYDNIIFKLLSDGNCLITDGH